MITPSAAAAWALSRALVRGGGAWLIEPGSSGDPQLAHQVVERLTHLGIPARALDSARSSAGGAGSAWVASAGLDDLLSSNGLGSSTAAVLLVARAGRTRRAALVEASALLRGSGISVPGVLVL